MRVRGAAAALLASVLAVAACGGQDTTTAQRPDDPTRPRPAPVAEIDPRDVRPASFTISEMTFVDRGRPTPESPNGPQLESRTVGVWLYLPDVDGPAPLVVFSHGMAGHPDAFEELHTAWAEAGYAVAAPIFPLTNRSAQGAFTNLFDVPGQPGDVSFVLDRLLALSDDPTSELAGRFDADRLAAAGLSAGGATTYEVAVNGVSRDRRFVAAIILAGTRYTNTETGTFEAPVAQPVLLLHGDADPLVDISHAETGYADLGAPRFFVTLLGGGHAGPFQDAGEGIEAQVPGQAELIQDSTTAFLDRYVLDIADAEGDLLVAADDPALTTFVFDVG